MKTVKPLSIVSLLVLCIAGFTIKTTSAQSSLSALVEMEVPCSPTPVRGNGKIHIGYEIHLTNFGPNELTLKRIEVLDHNKTQLRQYEGNELAQAVSKVGGGQGDKLKLGGGLRQVIYLWLTVNSESAVPATLQHRITFTTKAPQIGGDSKAEVPESEVQLAGAATKVHREGPVVLGPPLRGGEWVAANGPGNGSGHRRAIIPIEGKARVPQRFAIDWVQLREDGKTWAGDQLKNESYRAYGAELLAVADSVVVDIKDGIPENIPGINSRAVPITLETVGGNYVTLDLGKSRYAFYAHVKLGTIRVKVGDKVKRGQVIGLLGNSGNSTEPHLHFHVSDNVSPLGSEGLPYVFDSFELQGNGWKKLEPSSPVEKRRMEIPLQNAVVRFP